MAFFLSNNPEMDISKIISANLTEWMETHPTLNTFKKVATRAGVGYGTVRRAAGQEPGNVTIQNLAALAEAFKKPVVALITRPSPELAYSAPALATTHRVSEPSSARTFALIEAEPQNNPDHDTLIRAFDIASERDKGRLLGLAERIIEDFTRRNEKKT